jgi:hypothetical protein
MAQELRVISYPEESLLITDLLITDYLEERRRSNRWPSWPVVGI